ncbi:MAG TPA: hypothetical protein VL854_14320 [Nitrososphaeraceae archaeon]|nr:hypothetical protein [Nitrososphaeraceae archaeon]
MDLLGLCIFIGLMTMVVAGVVYIEVKDNELIDKYRNRDGDTGLKV